MAQDLVGRVKRLLLSPKAEWDAIDGESVDRQKLITGYVAPLAAIPAIAAIIGMGLFGPFGFGSAVAMALTQFVLAIVMVFVFALIIDALAPTFGAQKNFDQALKVTAHYPTAVWVAGIFAIVPALAFLGLIGLVYSLYLLFVGLPKLMKPPPEKATTYTIVSIVVAIIAGVIISVAARPFMPQISYERSSAGERAQSNYQERADALERAAESGDFGAVLGAAAGMMGGDPDAPLADGDALRALAPGRIAGLDRQSLEIESVSAPIKAVVMTAIYEGGGKNIEVTVTNSPMISAMMGLAGFADAAYDRSSDDGYERLRRDGDSIIVEEWSESSNIGRYGRSYHGSFLVQAKGRGVSMRELERVVTNEFSERKLENLRKEK